MIIFITGGNDICTFLCAMKDPESLPRKHKRNIYQAVKYLKDFMPRFVNSTIRFYFIYVNINEPALTLRPDNGSPKVYINT